MIRRIARILGRGAAFRDFDEQSIWINPLIKTPNIRVYPLEKTDKTVAQSSVLSISS